MISQLISECAQQSVRKSTFHDWLENLSSEDKLALDEALLGNRLVIARFHQELKSRFGVTFSEKQLYGYARELRSISS